MYGDRAMAEQDERKGDPGAEAARPADACADLLWDRSPATAEAVARFFARRSAEHTSELQSLMRTSYAAFCSNKNTPPHNNTRTKHHHTHQHPTHSTTNKQTL